MNDRSLCTFPGDDWHKCLFITAVDIEVATVETFALNQKPTGHLFFCHDSCCFLEAHHCLPIVVRDYPAEVCRDCIYVSQQIEPRLSVLVLQRYPSIWPFFSMTFVQTCRHMLYQSTDVECDRPVIVSAYLTHWGREGSFKLFKRPFPGFLTILTL